VFKEAYGKSVIEVLKMVHQQAGRENDDCRLIFAERKNFSIRRIAEVLPPYERSVII
jgi:hypothetical protein